LSRLFYNEKNNSVRIERKEGEEKVVISIFTRGPFYQWSTSTGIKGSGEGYKGLHKLCDSVGDLSYEEFEFMKDKI
jgi:hypothetical protein